MTCIILLAAVVPTADAKPAPQEFVELGSILPAPASLRMASAALPAEEPVVELSFLEPYLAAPDVTATALCRAAHLAITLGLMSDGRADEQRTWYREAESYARRAMERDPSDIDARFMLGAALGLRASHEPIRDRMRMAEMIKAQADSILDADPDHPGGLHLRGQLHATGMRLNSVLRFVARTILGGEVLEGASWETAERSFRRAVELEPENLGHRMELVVLLRDTGREAEAAAQARAILDAERSDPLAAHYKRRAREALDEMDGG